MATGLDKVLEHLHRVLTPHDDGLTDGQLLARFVSSRDEASFAALVRRHGPMVLGVCRRLLRHAQDAEDCFQVAFLVLARKAASVVKRESVGSFLYGVAYRTALTARAVNRRRQARERQVEEMPHPEVTPADVPDWRPWLDRELSRLPEKYRTPVILCDLEGRTRREVARHLSLPEGTLSSRLATARRMLAKRLSRYELPLAGGVLALSFSGAASAGVPESLVASTTKAALLVAAGQATSVGFISATVATLTEGVLKTMFIAKVKTATVVLFGVAALGLGTGGLMYQTRAGAADARQADRGLVTRSGAETAQQEKDRDKRAAEDARDREQALREELEKARREAEAARAEAQTLRQRAEAERKRAEEAMRALKEQLEAARRDRVKVRFANDIRQAEGEFNKRAEPSRRGETAEQRKAQAELELIAARINEQFEGQRRALQEQLKKLEEQQKAQLADLKRRAEMLQRQDVSQSKSEGGPAAARGDKLDQILQRLERLEQRLDRLERRKE
jgi:RNA polymerase sigma factor (sigma-70 family)